MTKSPAAGEVFLGKYLIERVLGQGGMGMVLAARHIDLGQRCAIKLLLPTVLAHHEALERFLREARAAAILKSDHVARVHDVGRTDDGEPYMIMEYLEGHDLKAVVARDGPLPADVAMTYLAQASEPAAAIPPAPSSAVMALPSAAVVENRAMASTDAPAPTVLPAAEIASVKTDAPKVVATNSTAPKKAPLVATRPASDQESGGSTTKKRSVL